LIFVPVALEEKKIGFIFVAGLIGSVTSKTIKVKKETFDDNKKELGI
jgi:hypothetical protein